MDGNRRWAKARGLSTFQGHREGYNAARRVAEACFDAGVQFVSVYAFSTENWRREASEVSYLMKLLALAVSAKEIAYFKKNGIRLYFLGRRDRIEPKLLKAMKKGEADTANLTRGTLAVCLDYGGQQEIADAVQNCLRDGLSASDITPEAIGEHLYAPSVPTIDMVTRTSGEQRISNFMLWRSAYSELFFLQKHWPEMTKTDVTAIIEEYARRSRRFGG